MDGPATLTREPDVMAPDVTTDDGRPVDAGDVETSAEPPVQYPLDDEERNLVDRVEAELVLED